MIMAEEVGFDDISIYLYNLQYYKIDIIYMG